MKKIFTKVLTLLTALTVVFSAAACQKGGTPSSTPAALALVGPSECTLTEGYSAYSTAAFRVTGLGRYDFAVFAVAGDTGIAFNTGTNCIDIAAGLEKGVYSAVVTATVFRESGEEERLEQAFTLTVELPAIPEGAPSIAGIGYSVVQKGYSSFSTERFILTGTGVTVAITGITKNGVGYNGSAFVWEAAERRLRITAGLDCGQYAVTLTASNTVETDDDFDFIYMFTVNDTVTPVLDGPREWTISEGYLAGVIDGFMVLGTGTTLRVTTTDAANATVSGKISYSATQKALVVSAGLIAGAYTVKMVLIDSNAAIACEHELALTVAEAAKAVTLGYAYASGKVEGSKITNANDRVTATLTSEDGKFSYPVTVEGSTGTVKATLAPGRYTFALASNMFCPLEKTVTVSESGTDDFGALTFTVPRVTVETSIGFSYNDSGFTIPSGNTTYNLLAGVEATEGFTIGYTMKSAAAGGNVWLVGGFFFRIDNTCYSLLVYPYQGTASAARISLVQNDNGVFRNIFYAMTTKQVNATTTGIDVEIAFYQGAFYLKIDGNFAVRLGADLFSASRHCKTNDCPLYLSDAQYNAFLSPATNYGTIKPAEFFGTGARRLGLRAIDTTCTFTNVSYKLGNTAAKAAVDAMRPYAQNASGHDGAWAN